jgi:hypothetical protein
MENHKPSIMDSWEKTLYRRTSGYGFTTFSGRMEVLLVPDEVALIRKLNGVSQ